MVLIVASLFLEMGWQKLRKDDSSSAILYQGSTLFASVVFLISQVGLWNRMISAGFLPSTDLMGAFFYAFTGLHGLHIVGAVGTLGWLFWKMHTIEESELLIRWTVNARMFVHFLTVVWLFIFVRLFVMV